MAAGAKPDLAPAPSRPAVEAAPATKAAPNASVPATAVDADPDDDLPPPDPDDPLERLYGRKQLNFIGGAPAVTVRLMEGQKEVRFSPRGRMRLLARGGLEKTIDAPANSRWTVRIRNFEPGVVSWSVQVGEFKYADRQQLDEASAMWRSRGYEVRTEVVGSLYGISGKVLDNRRHVLLLGRPGTEEEGRATLKALHQKYGVQGSLASKLSKRPHALLEVVDGSGVILAVAQDLVSVTSPEGAPFLVESVEHGVGYSWHGRQDRVYSGDLEFVVDKLGGISVVNVLPMETYLRGIVPSEIFARAHPEALKAQAVTARGEVLAKIGAKHLTDPYLLCAEQHCQVYSGQSGEAASTNKAILDTRGEVLFTPDGRRPVDSVYSAVCGGHTEDNEHVWGTVPDPTLRGRPDVKGKVPDQFRNGIDSENLRAWLAAELPTYCRLSSFANASKYRWEKRFTQAQVDNIAAPFKVGRVRAMAVAKRGRSGRAVVLTISGEEGATQVRGELTIRRLFGNLNSAMFEVEPPSPAHPGEWVFRGGGWGHGVGMCQLGAIGRAEHGHGYRDILRHYYNGAEVLRIY